MFVVLHILFIGVQIVSSPSGLQEARAAAPSPGADQQTRTEESKTGECRQGASSRAEAPRERRAAGRQTPTQGSIPEGVPTICNGNLFCL